MDLFFLDINNFNFEADYAHQQSNTVISSDNTSKYNCHHEAGRFILKYAAADFFNIKNPEIEIINNKPAFKYSEIKFSISHSGNIAAVCFDENPVGFDIEKITPRNYKKIASRMKFNMKENSLKEFYKCWTAYEAEYKLQEEARYIYSAEFNTEYIISVASNKTSKISEVLKIKEISASV